MPKPKPIPTHRTKNKYLMPLLAVLAALILVGIGLLAYYQKHPITNTGQTNTTLPTNTVDPAKPTEQTPYDPTEGGKYLVITEWGVRFPIPEIYKDDIEYEIRNDTRDGVGAGSRNGNFAGITLKSMKQQPNYIKDCVPVAIFRAKEPSAHFPQADTHLGIYYYQALSGGALCYAGDPPVNEPNLLADIAQVVRLIEVIPVK